MAKPNNKSVRLSDEALKIVLESHGEGFNDKFEKLILDYKYTLPQRLAELKALDKRINDKRKELELLSKIALKIKNTAYALDIISNQMPNIEDLLKYVSQEIDQARPVASSIEIQK